MKLISWRTTQYILFEMIPSFVLGLLVFIFILLMFQALRLTEFVLIHGVSIKVVGDMMTYLAISFLPALFPMSLLFSILLTYSRLSQDSEIVAFKACGMNQFTLTFPAIVLGLLVTMLSAHTSFQLAPWGNRQFEILITELGQTKASATIREGTFSEGFFDLVIYANKVHSETGELEKVFIYDEKAGEAPLTIIAKKGELIQDPLKPGHSALLRLFSGDIHRKTETHTKINFNSFDIKLSDPIREEKRAKSPPSLTLNEISEKLQSHSDKKEILNPEDFLTLHSEFHKRWAISILCFIFAVLGVGLGTQANRRNQKSSSMITCLLVIVVYWILYVSLEGLARSGKAPVALSIWAPNFIFGLFTIYRMKLIWN